MVSFLDHVTFTLAAAGGGGGAARSVHSIRMLAMWLVSAGGGVAVIGLLVGLAGHVRSARVRS